MRLAYVTTRTTPLDLQTSYLWTSPVVVVVVQVEVVDDAWREQNAAQLLVERAFSTPRRVPGAVTRTVSATAHGEATAVMSVAHAREAAPRMAVATHAAAADVAAEDVAAAENVVAVADADADVDERRAQEPAQTSTPVARGDAAMPLTPTPHARTLVPHAHVPARADAHAHAHARCHVHCHVHGRARAHVHAWRQVARGRTTGPSDGRRRRYSRACGRRRC